jgi:hypothetical protein
MRTTIADVRAIIETSLLDAGVTAYITAANNFVTAHLNSAGLTTELLAEIERWTAAHQIAATRERMAKKEGAGGAEIEYLGKFETGLYSTPYGQMAINLDPTGKLAAIANSTGETSVQKSVKITSL